MPVNGNGGRRTGPLRVLTWPVHGKYLWSLSSVPVRWFVATPPDGCGTTTSTFPDTVIEVAADDVHELDIDVVLYQSRRDLLDHRSTMLTEAQRAAPCLYLEHDPPLVHPTDALHPAAGQVDGIVHVTHYNRLMWDCGRTPTTVVEHGVAVPRVKRTLARERGIVVVNHLGGCGRQIGADLVERLRREVPLDIVGVGSESMGGLGEVPPAELAALVATYRFFFHPARYTSLGLTVLEAMHCGVPVVGLPTTELASVLTDGRDGYLAADERTLADRMDHLLADSRLAHRVGRAGERTARRRFGITRFQTAWLAVLEAAAARRMIPEPPPFPPPFAPPERDPRTKVVPRAI